jgi:hypothetical protein
VHVFISCHLDAYVHVHFILLPISFLLLATSHEIMINDLCRYVQYMFLISSKFVLVSRATSLPHEVLL